jgi:hypothetical protein
MRKPPAPLDVDQFDVVVDRDAPPGNVLPLLAELLLEVARRRLESKVPPGAGPGAATEREVAGVMAGRQKAAEGPADGQLTG